MQHLDSSPDVPVCGAPIVIVSAITAPQCVVSSRFWAFARLMAIVLLTALPMLAHAEHFTAPISDFDHVGMGTFTGNYTQSTTDHPWFIFNANAGNTVTINVTSSFTGGFGSGSYTWLYRAPDGCAEIGDFADNNTLQLVQTAGNGANNYTLTYTVPATGQFAVQLDSWLGGSGAYTVTLSGSTATTVLCSTLIPTLSTSPLATGPFCAGQALAVPFTVSGPFAAGNVFSAQLSNAAGSFASPVTIGTLTGTGSGTIAATIPAGTPAGTGYRIRVVGSTPAVTGTDNGSNLTINAAPVLTLPASQTVAATTGQCSASVAFAASATNQASIVYTLGGTPITSPYTFPVGTSTVTVRATNNCGTATGTFTVTVQDRQAPTVRAAGFQTALVNGTRTIEAADVDGGSFDNCGIVSLSISPRTFTCANIGPNQVTLTVTDNSGNVATQTVTVIIVDNTAPVVLAAGLQINLINGTRTIEAADVDYGSYDDCGSIVSLTLSKTTFTCANVGPNQVTLTVRDNSGNTASQTVTVLVVDNTAPVVVAAGFQTTLINGTRTIEAADVDGGSYDDCGSIASLSISPRTFTCANVGPNQVTLTVRDNAGNVATQTVTVMILADATCTNSVASRSNSASANLSNESQLQAYPNPITDQAMVSFRPTQAGKAQIKVYNQLGVVVATLYDGAVEGNRLYSVTLNGQPLASGVYNCQLITNGKVTNQRLLVSK